MAFAVHRDYVLAFQEGATFFTGDVAPLKWLLTRKDGAACDTPTAATVKIRNSLGALAASITPDLDPAPPAGGVLLAGLWTVPASGGAYAVQLTVTVGTDAQVRSDREILVVR